MITPGSPTVRRQRLAAGLRGFRRSKGKIAKDVAMALEWSPAKISRNERARIGHRTGSSSTTTPTKSLC
jgi:hypothetical protein